MSDGTKISDAVKKCIAILKTSNGDTEKFAALFMVTKLVKGKDCTAFAKKSIFEAIGFEYINKLLKTDDVPIDCPPIIYKSVALSILSVFCVEEELATHPDMLNLVPIFLEIFTETDVDDEDESLKAIMDAHTCLTSVACFAAGQEALIKARGVPILTDYYVKGEFQSEEALKILTVLIGHGGTEIEPTSLHALLNKVALDFESDQSKNKFTLCTILGNLIQHCDADKQFSEAAYKETWPESLYKGLADILRSKITAQQRNPALILVASVVNLLGVEWTMLDEANPKQFFLLLIQLAAIEIRMQLDGNNLKSAPEQRILTTSCYVILELSLNYITSDQIELEADEKRNLYAALKGALNSVIKMLLKSFASGRTLESGEKVFVCASIRVLAAWIAHGNEDFETEINQILPKVLVIANESFYEHQKADVLRILLPGLCHLTVKEDSRKIILNAGEDKVFADVLKHHWNVVNYKRPPVPRSERLKVLSQPKQEIPAEILAEMHNSRVAMISACNVLMNITALEPQHVENSPVFNELLNFIFESLPELKESPDNLVLHGNLAVFGLLLLKQLSKRVKQDDFSICRYIQVTIRFLWDAYVVDESSDPSTLVVAMGYKEHWLGELSELWFLGMQTMSGVIELIPWLAEFAIESGWAEGIVQILKKVRPSLIPASVKSAFEDLLSNLGITKSAIRLGNVKLTK